MTTTTPGAPAVAQVTFTIDDVEVAVPQGTLVIRAAEQVGIQIPRFCDHPLLAPAGACRQCLVEVAVPDREGTVRPMPKPQASCTLEATPGMVVRTQRTSAVADKAQQGVMELLLINHPLDCPTCDKGGECPLQNQAMSNGRATSRFHDPKRTFAKPISVSTQILLDRERCILCQRCTRFTDEIAGDLFIDLQMRGARQQIGTFSPSQLGFAGAEELPVYRGSQDDGTPIDGAVGLAATDPTGPVGASELDTSGRPFSSYFSGNTVQICPVGALTSAAYRFRARPFDLVSVPSIAEHDSNGSAIRVDHRRGVVMRRLAGDDPVVNQEWITDKDRFAFTWQSAPDRLTTPMVRARTAAGARGDLVPASWHEAVQAAAEGLAAARAAGGVGVLPGGRVPLEDAYAYAKFARVALGTNDVDHRARPHSAEEADFLGHAVAGAPMSVTFADLATTPTVLLVGWEPEDEGGVAFLRLRSGVRAGTVAVHSVAPYTSRGLERLGAALLRAAPGTEAEVLDAVVAGGTFGELAGALAGGGLVLVGERLATVPGGLSAALRLAERTGARLAWIPRRAGERGAVEAGTLPGLLPGGRPVTDTAARVDVAAHWEVGSLPAEPGKDTAAIIAAAAGGELGGLLVGGVDPGDLPDPGAALAALDAVGFLVSLEVRPSAVTERADVVLPVVPPVERPGTFLTWEGRPRPFPRVLTSTGLPDHRVLGLLAAELGVELGTDSLEAVHAELGGLGPWDGTRTPAPTVPAGPPAAPTAGQAVLATWHLMLDGGRLQDGEAFLAGTAQRAVVRLGAGLAADLGLAEGDPVTVSTDRGALTLPAALADLPDGVVWLPLNQPGHPLLATLGVGSGGIVTVAAGDPTASKER